ncbi:MAG: Aldo/keto reductase [Chthoniobacteraceae bacterium]|nr:Aldo/keto reductase [Chthoniobacteraceae bacterium]
MQTIRLGSGNLVSSRLAYGCWRIARSADAAADLATARRAVLAAIDAGYTLFDHADIYCDGRAETSFGAVLRETPSLRNNLLIATKCGIRFAAGSNTPYRYDLSAEHIIGSCDESLRRLGVETIDIYQLHRPDFLIDAEEVSRAFDELHRAGKVHEFGVSNFSPSQLALLQGAARWPLVVNQVEISLLQLSSLGDGTLDQCQAEKITPLAWSPLGGGLLADGPVDILAPQRAYQPAQIVALLDEMAQARGTSRMVLALAWLLRHPAGIVPIVGSTEPGRIAAAVEATQIELSRDEWYRLLTIARGVPLP